MGTRVAYPIQIKEMAIKMKQDKIPVKTIMEELGIKNKTQIETWWRWYRHGENHRLVQPVGKQYSYGKGPEELSTETQLKNENNFLKIHIDGVKKIQRVGKDVEPEIFVELVKSMKGKLTTTALCQLFEVSRATYYRWTHRKDLGKLTALEEAVRRLCFLHKFRYGYRKIAALINQEYKVNKNTIQRIMQKYHWNCRVKIKKRNKVGQPYKIVENKLNRQFASEAPLKKLVTDITYLPFGQKQLYLSSVMDLYNGEIIAYTIGDKQDTAFVLDTLDQLPKTTDCLLHSDQGSVYTSFDYQNQIKSKGITMSMSRKGTPSDNACIESFHASLKSETFYLDKLTNEPTSIVIETVKEYITYYNEVRIQQKLGYQSPIEYRKLAA
ncbi:IS3 family transposase [Enterococcus gallinarum]|uniref:IS3 family transposase n=1 Tax=Enterococcus TaxID=1350 RepID=UPI000DF5D784|nr:MULTISPECIES: IS3 family transposase [Enterococcus]AXG39742.1 IS3 family transposase [Enterococcus gilvus]AXG40632.1 IS3 family transposase [Enterococcus gilvus]MDT2709326.1 IS3 family transposase [Enterococcus gallinarum]MDT2718343.1 IS3 family transposase [Enterococcus gallinarum]